jgi:hypothetical protein
MQFFAGQHMRRRWVGQRVLLVLRVGHRLHRLWAALQITLATATHVPVTAPSSAAEPSPPAPTAPAASQPTHPATPIVTPNAGTPNRNQRLSREEMMALTMTAAADKGTATMQQYVAPRNPRLDVGPRLTIRPTQQTPPPPLPEEPKSNLLMWGALAVGAVLILRRPRRSVSGFGGYGGRRRRSRR